MRIIRGLAAVAITACAAVGLAGPAHADDRVTPGTPQGVYTVDIAGQGTTTWEIYPICVPTVGDLREPLYIPVGCRLKVTPSGRGGSEAVQVGGLWTFEANTFDSVRTCPDGSEALQQEIYSFDGYTLTGTLKIIHGAICGEQPGMVTMPLTMTFKEPLAIPVDQYPLICEPGGLRRCF